MDIPCTNPLEMLIIVVSTLLKVFPALEDGGGESKCIPMVHLYPGCQRSGITHQKASAFIPWAIAIIQYILKVYVPILRFYHIRYVSPIQSRSGLG